jgi:DNA ligase-1
VKVFPTLYKKGSTGAIQFWEIQADQVSNSGRITTTYGQLGTDSPQVTRDLVLAGTNVGKKNERTPYAQAEFEAEAKWTKQKKKGYVESKEAAESGEVDAVIEGGITPMLAQKYADHADKMPWPAYVQPKLDGIRCIAIVEDGSCSLWTRTRKLITSCPHIEEQVEEIARRAGVTHLMLDGELYNHELKADFEKIVSAVRKKEPSAESLTLVQYHVYDIPTGSPFAHRNAALEAFFKEPMKYVKLVETHLIDPDGLQGWFDHWRAAGYEGAMVRDAGKGYENKRSYSLLKVKEFDDAEFRMIDAVEGRGKLMGHVGAFVCEMPGGTTFECKMSGDTEKLREYWQDHSLWKGKLLSVKYQGLTTTNKVPRFPVGVAIRDYE